MSVELLHTLSVVSFIAAGVLFVVSVLLFFLFRVPRIYGDISSRTAKKAIAAIRRQNEGSGNSGYKPNPLHTARGIRTEKIPQSKESPTAEDFGMNVGTQKLSASDPAYGQAETTILETTAYETAIMQGYMPQTGETSNLYGELSEPSNNKAGYDDFTVEVEMGFAGSSEIIE